MFGRRKNTFSMADFVTEPLTVIKEEPKDVLIDRPTIPKENTTRLKIDKQEVMKTIRKDNEIVDKESDKKNAILKEENFESLKAKFLTMRNKPLFIQRNKNMIKSLKTEDQKNFILLAKEHM